MHAFTWIDPGRALSIARDYDRAGDPGVLAGLPIAVKDVIDTAGIATEYGLPIYAGRVPRADAASAAAVRAAGGYVFGKTVTAESPPHLARPATRTGWNTRRAGRRAVRPPQLPRI